MNTYPDLYGRKSYWHKVERLRPDSREVRRLWRVIRHDPYSQIFDTIRLRRVRRSAMRSAYRARRRG